ncbi:DSBA oxidoreductase [Fructilactobacillus fructivorans]|nr:DSBA oxidoreductase [Fructilactobacillus fructivorans]
MIDPIASYSLVSKFDGGGNQMAKKMEVQVWSDIACPFCYIGRAHFKQALADFDHKDDVEVHYNSFELDTTASGEPETMADHMSKEKGMSKEKVDEFLSTITELAKETGLKMDTSKIKVVNTLKAYRLLHFAETKGKESELMDKLFEAYFADGLNVDDNAVLTDLAMSVGLNQDEVKSVLDSDKFKNDVRADEAAAQQVGINGVPFYVFNKKYAVSGAQPFKVFKSALDKAWDSFKPIEMVGGDDDQSKGANCEGGSCSVDPNANNQK